MKIQRATTVLCMAAGVAAVLAGCGGGGGGAEAKVYCDFIRGIPGFSNNQTGPGATENVYFPMDEQLQTFAYLQTGGQRSFTYTYQAPSSVTYNDLPRAAGAFVTIVAGSADTVTLSTYLDGVLQQTASDVALDRRPTGGRTSAEEYLSINATLPFDEVRMAVTTTAGSEYSVYEFCADGDIFD